MQDMYSLRTPHCLRVYTVVGLWLAALAFSLSPTPTLAQPQFELENNWLMNVSYLTGTDRGVAQNIEDNLTWMQSQGYTHLRFFGIFPNHVHCFPSATLDAHGYPNSAFHEPVLAVLAAKCTAHGITLSFDGIEIIAEANRDTAAAGVGYIDEQDMAAVVDDILSLGVPLITEEQFGFSFLRVIDSVAGVWGATHETTAGMWWTQSDIADEQLASVFSFYPYDQAEADSILATSSLPGDLGTIHIWGEGAKYYGVPFNVAVGSFGSLASENWKNVLLYTQIAHSPQRLSIEEQNWDFPLDPGFNFMSYVGNELVAYAGDSLGERPVANLIIDPQTITGATVIPAYQALLVNGPAIANTFTTLGYRVVPTIASVLPEAEAYYVLLFGGTDPTTIVPLPDYVMPLLEGDKPVFVQPCFGIPDDNDATDWIPVREFFGLPSGETVSIGSALPVTVSASGWTMRWAGVEHLLTPVLEILPADQINTTVANVEQSALVAGDDVALVVTRGNKALINSNLIHLETSFLFSNILGSPLNRPAPADVTVADGKLLIFAEHASEIDMDMPWPGLTHLRRYNPLGDLLEDADVELGANYTATLTEGELIVMFRVPSTQCGDSNGDLVLNVMDVVYLIDHVYRGGEAPYAPTLGDVNGDSFIDINDIVALAGYIFAAAPALGCL